MDSPNKVNRWNIVESLSTSAIQEWKASRENALKPEDGQDWWNNILNDLGADDNCPLRVNKYSGKFHEFCGLLYERSNCPIVKVVPSICERALDTTDRIVDLVRTLGYKGQFTEEWYKWHDVHYAILYMEGTWGSNLKYHTLWLFNHYEDLTQQPRSTKIVGKDGCFVWGKPGEALKARLRKNDIRSMECRNTLLQGFKKSLLPLDERDWKDTVVDTADCLSAIPDDLPNDVVHQLQRTARELKKKMPPLRIKKNYTLSKSSCIDSTRAQGGFAGEFFRQMGLWNQNTDPFGIIYRTSPPELVGDVRYHNKHQVGLVYSRCPYNYRDVHSWADALSATEGCSTVQIRVIPEPFKFRVISIGEYDVYKSLKPVQEMLWSTLQRFNCFCLTGCGADDLLGVVQNLVSKWKRPGMKFCNGDYQAATNKLSSEASRILTQEWLSEYPEVLRILNNSLFYAELDFCDAGKGVEALAEWDERGKPANCSIDLGDPTVPMVNGQLMGHPCSFPILCAVNAAMCRWSLEKVWKRKFSLRDLPLLINGDDCLLIGEECLLETWRKDTRQVGLLESIGKSYFTDKFCMINSRYLPVRSVPLRKEIGEFMNQKFYEYSEQAYVHADIGYVNLGILNGRKKGSNVDVEVKVTAKVSDSSAYAFWNSASDNFKQMNLRCKKLRIPVEEYVKRYKRFFDAVPLPLYLKKEHGGYGFEGGDEVVLFPRNPFAQRREGRVMLGEAYWSGGMASVLDDTSYPDFIREARFFAKKVKTFSRSSVATCVNLKDEVTWTVTSA